MTDAPARLLRVSTRSLVVCCAGLAMAATPSCEPKKGGIPPSFVERGELYVSGTVVYDAWFQSVHDLQQELAMLPIEERNHLVPLTTALDLIASSDTALILDRLRRVRQDLPAVELVIAQPDEIDAKLVVASGEKPDKEQAKLLGTIETVANAELKAALRLSDMPERARRLKVLGKTLEQNAPKDLKNRPAREARALTDEIDVAIGLLDRIAAQAPRERDSRRAFVRGMREALKRGR